MSLFLVILTPMVSGLVLFVHRHGDRSPWASIPGDDANNASWPDGLGQLTAKGMQQTHFLGRTIRERYSIGNYSRYEYYVRSTDYDRTLQSAQCVLSGIFPPGSGPTSSLNSMPASLRASFAFLQKAHHDLRVSYPEHN